MGERVRELRRRTARKVRTTRLTDEEQSFLRASATYEGSPLHKLRPSDFGLHPPANPRPDKTLCDVDGPLDKAQASAFLKQAIERGIVSDQCTGTGFPKQMWVVSEGRVFEAMYGGSRVGAYHGYPVRETDPLFAEVMALWGPA